MNPVKTSIALSGMAWTALFFGCFLSSAAARDADCSPFRFESKVSVPLQDLRRLSNPQTVSGKTGEIVFWPFDDEDRPTRPGAYAIGLLAAGHGDIGETPVGGYLWVQRTAKVTQSFVDTSRSGDASAEFAASPKTAQCSPTKAVFRLSQDGELMFGGEALGKVK